MKSVEVDGKNYNLKLGIHATGIVEKKLGKAIHEIGTAPAVFELQTIFWGALLHHDKNATMSQAGDLMDKIGFNESGDIIGELLDETFPEPDESGDEGKNENPAQ